MKRRFFDRYMRRWQRQTTRQKRFVTYDNARHVCILYNSDGRDEVIRRVVRQLIADKKSVEAWGYFDGKQAPAFAETDKMFLLTRRDVSLLGRPRKQLLMQMNSRPTDLLIDLSTVCTFPLLYAALVSEAPMKVSSHTDSSDVFDFLLKMDDIPKETTGDQVEFLFEQILLYLKNIRSND